ncbi:hypothetical protein PAPHI01_0049 [Pancytospora philotis]|nr:hypothetical protein PAPHI01_0049 [Pancytospora philotis]
MWPAAVHQVILLLINATASAATANKPFLLPYTEIAYDEVSPFQNMLHVQRDTHELLRSMYQKVTRLRAAEVGQRIGKYTPEWSSLCTNMVYWVITFILQQEKPAEFISLFINRERLSEYSMLARICERFVLFDFNAIYSRLTPPMDPAAHASVSQNAPSQLAKIKEVLLERLEEWCVQSPEAFIADHRSGRVSKDIMAYVSLRSELGARSVQDELSAVLAAINARVDVARCDGEEEKVLATFLCHLLGFRCEKRMSTAMLYANTLDYVTAAYNTGLIRLMLHDQFKISTVYEVIKYTCGDIISRGDPHFVHGLLAALKEHGKISAEEEIGLLTRYLCKSDQSTRMKLLDHGGAFLELLPIEALGHFYSYVNTYECASKPKSNIDIDLCRKISLLLEALPNQSGNKRLNGADSSDPPIDMDVSA